MAQISAILKIHETGNGTIRNFGAIQQTNNISSIPYSRNLIEWVRGLDISNKTYRGAVINHVNKMVLGDQEKGRLGIRNIGDGQYVSKYKGLIFGYTNNSSVLPLTLIFSGTDMSSIKIVFDPYINNYPTTYKLFVDNVEETRTNASNELEVTGISGNASSIRFQFTTWSKPNETVAITFIENQVVEEPVDKSSIISFESESELTSSPQTALTGVLANTGSIKLKDNKNVFYNYSQLGYLQMNTFGVELYVNTKLVQKHIVTDNPYYSSDKTMEIRLTDNIAKMDNIELEDKVFAAQTSLYTILVDIMTRAGYNQDVVDDMIDDVEVACGNPTYTFMQLVTLDYFFKNTRVNNQFTLQGGSLSQQLNKICQCGNLYLTTSRNGDLKFTSARITQDYGSVIEIPYKKQASAFSFDLLTNNRYSAVEILESETIYDKNVLKYGSNEMFENTLLYYNGNSNFRVDQMIQSDLLFDYRNGIRTGTLDIFPSDLDNIHGDQVKEWLQGDLVNIGDIVCVLGKDNTSILKDDYQDIYWKVIGCKVRYEGQVIVSLILRETKNYYNY